MRLESQLTLKQALVLSERQSVEWRIYKGLTNEITLKEIKDRLTFLRHQLNPKYRKYGEVLAAYLEDELLKREQEYHARLSLI
jgi:hypothetical protein